MDPKTILMPIYHGRVSKSVFHTDIYKCLAGDSNIKLIVAIPALKLDFYKKNFAAPNVVFEPVDLKMDSGFGRALNRVAFNLLPTSTVRGKQRLYYHRYGGYLKFLVISFANRFLGPLTFVRGFIRFLDGFVPLDPGVVAVLKKYKPDLVLLPDVVFLPDPIFARAAKRMDIFSVAMARSWDNLTSKGVVQVLPNKLIVYSNRMVEEAVGIVGMKREDIFMAGPPQFDIHFKKGPRSRGEFLKSLGINPASRIVLCAPFFDKYTGSAVAMINELAAAIEDGILPKDVHLLVRYRPGTPAIGEGFLKRSSNFTVTYPQIAVFDGAGRYSPSDDFEWSTDDVNLLIDSLRFSDIVINTVSTLSIDAMVFDKPVINVRFDAEPKTPPEHSVNVMLPNHDHYKAIEASGGVKLVYSMNEMIGAINAYLKNPKLDFEGRERLRREQIVFMDGLAGRRIADFIKGELQRLS